MGRKKSPRKKPVAERPWPVPEIRELVGLLKEQEITEFELERNGVRIRIRRGNAPNADFAAPPSNYAALLNVSPPPPVPRVSEAPPASTGGEEEEAGSEDLHLIKSPIVGTFYAAPAPNAPPFVKLGDQVEVGQVLCIIEAMKLMNEIESEAAGEVVRIYLETGQPVEYGESLFAIKPSYKK